MNLNIRGEKHDITEAMKNYAEEKFERLSKYLDNKDEVVGNILFKINGQKQKLEITIPLKNYTLRVEDEGVDFYSIVDTSVDKLERQIVKNKHKLESKKTKDKVDFVFESFEGTKDEEENENKIVKRKYIELKPMDEEEAILQMELLGHDFYIFKNIDSDKVAVLYRRKNNDYGLIEEE